MGESHKHPPKNNNYFCSLFSVLWRIKLLCYILGVNFLKDQRNRCSYSMGKESVKPNLQAFRTRNVFNHRIQLKSTISFKNSKIKTKTIQIEESTNQSRLRHAQMKSSIRSEIQKYSKHQNREMRFCHHSLNSENQQSNNKTKL